MRSTWVCNFFFQNYLYNWRYKGVKGKNKTGATRKKFIFYFFFQLKFFCLLSQVFKNSMSLLDSKFTLISQEKIAKFQLTPKCPKPIFEVWADNYR